MKRLLLMMAIAALCAVSCKKAPADSIDVMTFNVRYGTAEEDDTANNWDNRKASAAAMIMDMHPAVFGVQEALDFQLEYFKENCPAYQYVGVGREDGRSDGEHMAVFYDTERIELEDWGTYWLSETPDVPSTGWDAACRRTATWTLLKDKANGRQLYFVNTHLDHVGVEARKNGLALVVERIAAMNPDKFPMVLCGDFNVYPDDPCLTDLRAMMQDAWQAAPNAEDGPTWHDWGAVKDGRHIDYIFYSDIKSCKSLHRVTQSYGESQYVSDHYPVFATLEY